MKPVKVLDLFSGIGGFSLGLERAGMETVAFCEIEAFPQKVLAKHWPDVPIYTDVKELTGDRLRADGVISDGDRVVLTGGYPCQPFSTAGQRRGENDDRHLWPEVARLIQELQPAFCVFENVAGHISLGLDQVLSDLEGLGYTAETFVIPACAVNAIHRRDRLWIIAYPDNSGNNSPRRGIDGNGPEKEQGRAQQPQPEPCRHISESKVWATQPTICRGDDGLSRRLDTHRLKALGNAVVPQIPEIIGRAIMAIEADKEQSNG